MRISRRHLFLGAAAAANAPAQALRTPISDARAIGRRFTGESLREIAFPIGGIGTGTVSLGGYGNLRDWEIFNRPNKNSILPFTFPALRLSGKSLREPALRVVERELLPPYDFSHGIGRERVAGLPRFREAVFVGSYPFATISFQDSQFPADVSLEAFNPMIPLDVERSSLPVAVFTYRVKSRAPARMDATLAFSIMNPVGYIGLASVQNRKAPFFGQNINEFRQAGSVKGLFLHSRKYPAGSFQYGSVALATDSEDVSYRLHWERGNAWDELPNWWREFSEQGRFPNDAAVTSEDGFTEYATLAAHFTLDPGQSRDITFVLAWHFPNIQDYWTGQKPYFFKQDEAPGRLLRNEYGTHWKDSWEPAVHTLTNLPMLREDTRRFRDSLYLSTLPPEVIDAVSSQASTLRTNTVLVGEGMVPLAFEGCGDDSGCCPMNCTHVYNYEQAMAQLYPSLERRVREIDLINNLRPDGYMSFRTATPLQTGAYTKRPAADGQMGAILKLYREWIACGDDDWLRKLWPAAKRALEFAWVEWDKDRDGVMEGEQHNTYDVQFFGPNSMVGSLYLGALAAAVRMARHLGDTPAADTYERVLRNGMARLDALLWNGEYYVQKVDDSRQEAAHWQFGEGCLSDQLLGQWLAELTDLGKLLPADHIRKCLAAIYRYNFHENLRDVPSAQRVYALNGEQGLVVCSWPRGKRPTIPFGYCDEVWTGVEYQVAAHMMFEGMVEQGVRIVRAVRDRHNGAIRNPWDEVECGHHYARAMASWSLLTALSGCVWSAPTKELRFRPKGSRKNFRSLYCAGSAWGTYSQERRDNALDIQVRVEKGDLELAALRVPSPGKLVKVSGHEGAGVRVSDGEAHVAFSVPAKLSAGSELHLHLQASA
jgi:uncharacterized protein (DUF608 family)